MKKIVGFIIAIFMLLGFLILLDTSSVRADVKINKKNFVEKDVRKIAKDADKNDDGILQDEEAKKVKDVVVIRQYRNDYDSVDLKGIRYFENTENLDLVFEFPNDNKIYVDIKNFSQIYKFKNLKDLDLYNLDSVSTVDVAKFEKLENLQISYMEELSNIEFGTNNKLEEIRLSNLKSMKKVDFSNLTVLKKVTVDNIPLEELYFGENNKTVKQLRIDRFGNRKYKIEKLDITKLTNLRILYVGYLDTIDNITLSKNKKLKNIQLVYCTSLDEIDLSKNKKLKKINLQCNGIKKVKLPRENVIEEVSMYKEKKMTKFSTKNLNPETLTRLYFKKTKLVKLDASKFDNLETIGTWSETEVIYPENNNTYKIVGD